MITRTLLYCLYTRAGAFARGNSNLSIIWIPILILVILLMSIGPIQYPNSFYGSSKNKVNLAEKMIEEFSLELARQLARLHFNPAIRTNQGIANNNNLWSIPLWPEVVGYLGYVCKNCLVIQTLPMCITSLGL